MSMGVKNICIMVVNKYRMYTHTLTHTYTHTRTHTHTHTHVCAHARTHACTRTCTRTLTRNVQPYNVIYTVYVCQEGPSALPLSLQVQ